MKRNEPQEISSLLTMIIRQNGWEKPFYERQIVDAWSKVLGPTIARYTEDVSIKDGILFVHIKSAPLRQELFNNRFQLVNKLHEAVGTKDIIRDIRLLS